MDNQFWLSVILLWKVDLRVIVNSPSCLSLDSQVTDQILIYALDKRCFLTSEIGLLISLYSLGRSSSDTEPSSTEGSSWRCSGEPGTELELRIHGLILTLYTPYSGSLPLSWQQVYCLFMENQYESGADSGVSFSSFLSLCLLLLLERIWGSHPLGFWLLDSASPPDSWASGFLGLGSLLWLLQTSWLLQVS